MEFSNNFPIYLQIMDLLKGKIISGEIKGGGKLPSVRDFSKEMKVNPNTIQRVYQELERAELVFTQRGLGTFVTEDEETIKKLKENMAENLVSNFLKEMKEMGYQPKEIVNIISKWLGEGEE